MPTHLSAAILLCTHALALLLGILIGSLGDAAMKRDPAGLRAVLLACVLLVVVAAVILATR